jgi:hypothetical protein
MYGEGQARAGRHSSIPSGPIPREVAVCDRLTAIKVMRDLVTARARRGPVPDQPTLTQDERTRFFDHLLVTADTKPQDDIALSRRQAIYLLGFDTRASMADWLRTEQQRALRAAGRTDHVPSWVAVRSSAVALSHGGDRDPVRAFLHQALTTNQMEQANLNY